MASGCRLDGSHFFLFREVFRVLKPGGVLAICDYSLVHPPKNIFEKFIIEAARRLWQVPKVNVYGNDKFQEILRNIGFANITIENAGALTIPGYFFEQRRLETVREIKKIRGWKGVIGGYLINQGVYQAYKKGLCEYIILRAQKPL